MLELKGIMKNSLVFHLFQGDELNGITIPIILIFKFLVFGDVY